MDHIRGAADTNHGGGFDPAQANALTDQATRQARRQFTPLTALLWTFRAVEILVVCGSIWLSVRGQHPYSGPAGWAWAVAVVAGALNVGLTGWVTGRAGTGVNSTAEREWLQPWKAIALAAWLIAYFATARTTTPGSAIRSGGCTLRARRC
jgi:hypothetical protein